MEGTKIKFRAYSVRDKIIIDWSTIMQTACNNSDIQLLYTILSSNDEDFIIDRFTGIKDVEGKEIYENDNIEFTQHYFNMDKTDVKTKTVKMNFDRWNVYESNAGESNVRVIGNIHLV